MNRVIISVSNDLGTDQRVHKICETLVQNGYEILLIGRLLPQSISLKFPFKTHRFKLFFAKGFLFYAEFNMRLFFKLLIERKAILYSNDLDTLLPNFIIHKIFKTKPYSMHNELYTIIKVSKQHPLQQI